MKKGTRNILLLGAAGAAAYFLFFKPQQAQQSAIEGNAAAGIAAGASDFAAGLGAYSALGGNLFNPLAPFMALANTAAQTAFSTLTGTAAVASSMGRIGATTSSATPAKSLVSQYNPNLVNYSLISNSPQAQLARQFNLPQSSINAASNFYASSGTSASFSNAGSTISGKYNPTTGTLISNTGQGYSVPAYLINTSPSKPPATNTNPLQPSKPAYFK